MSLRRGAWGLGICTAVAAAASLWAAGSANRAGPSVVVILIDTLRADRLGFMNYAKPTSPALDALARRAVVFDRAYSTAPWTPPSVASIFTGLYPSVHHVVDYQGRYGTRAGGLEGDVLAAEAETLAEGFSAAGYQTAAFTANPYVSEALGYAQGFDTFEFLRRPDVAYVSAAEVLSRGGDWLERRDRSRPFFLYLHLMDVHAPYNAPDEVRTRFVGDLRPAPAGRASLASQPSPPPGHITGIWAKTARVDASLAGRPEYWMALYDAGVAHVDQQVGAFLDRLKAAGLMEETILVVTSDHGEALNEQGGWSHGMYPYDHQYHVPLLFHCPRRWPAARRVPQTVSLVGVRATLLELAGLRPRGPGAAPSFAALVNGTVAPQRGFAFGEGVKHFDELKVAYSGSEKLIRDTARNLTVYFNLTRDPAERRREPVPRDSPSAVELERCLDATLAENASRARELPLRRTRMGETTRKRLEALGYLGGGDSPGRRRLPVGAFQADRALEPAPDGR